MALYPNEIILVKQMIFTVQRDVEGYIDVLQKTELICTECTPHMGDNRHVFFHTPKDVISICLRFVHASIVHSFANTIVLCLAKT